MAASIHTPQYEKFRLLIQEAREKKELTQAGLASRLGKPQSYVSKYESGERRLDVIEFLQVCRALDIAPMSVIKKLVGN
jgi:transcriptional regulator with XRE-family HTH domain